mgnify:CR=1 FL=1
MSSCAILLEASFFRKLLTDPELTPATLQWLLLGPWRGLFDKIAIWSPTIFLQPDWEPIIKYMKEKKKGSPVAGDCENED